MGKFKYKIESPVADAAFIDAPDGWKDSESIFPRSDTYKGIFRKFAANDLTFKSNGAQKLREINAVNNFESDAEFIQYETDFDTYTDFIRFRGKFDFVKYKSVDGNEGKNININVIDSGFWNTVKNRENIKPQLNQLTSLDGFQISGFTNEETFITLPRLPKIDRGVLNANSSAQITGNHSAPLIKAESEDQNVISVVDTNVTDDLNGAFYVAEGVSEITISVEYRNAFAVSVSGAGGDVLLKLKHYNQSRVQQNIGSDLLATAFVAGVQLLFIVYENDTFFPIVNDGDYFILSVESSTLVQGFISQPPYIANVNTAAEVDALPEVQISGMKIHELVSRNLQIISGVDIPLYAEILGDPTSEPRSYAGTGKLSNLLVTSGERVRGFSREESPLTLGFKETFESLFALSPICAVVETINGIENLRIEGIRYAFDDRIVLTVDNASDIEESYLSDRIFSRILVGFDKAEYEAKDGLFEYNQKSEFSTPISVVNNDYNIVSKIGADTNSINNAREKSKAEFPTEDTRYDNNNFFITLIRNNSVLLNGNFESWADDNNPDDWIVGGTGSVVRKNLLGSSRLFFNTIDFPTISQTFAFDKSDVKNVKLSYAAIVEGLSGTGYFNLSATNGGLTYQLKNDGTWIESMALESIFYADLVEGVNEIDLQSFLSFSLNFDECPISGDMTISILGIGGIVIDDVFTGRERYIAKTDEGYSNVENAIFGNNSLNLDISPARNLREHGSIIRACSENKLSQYLKFNTSEKNSTLSTQKDTESSPVVENADVQINDLEEPFFKPNQIDFNMVFDKSVIDVLNDTFAGETKPKYLGIVRFRKNTSDNYRYVWLLNPNTGGESQLGTMSGIEVNTDYVTPIEI